MITSHDGCSAMEIARMAKAHVQSRAPTPLSHRAKSFTPHRLRKPRRRQRTGLEPRELRDLDFRAANVPQGMGNEETRRWGVPAGTGRRTAGTAWARFRLGFELRRALESPLANPEVPGSQSGESGNFSEPTFVSLSKCPKEASRYD